MVVIQRSVVPHVDRANETEAVLIAPSVHCRMAHIKPYTWVTDLSNLLVRESIAPRLLRVVVVNSGGVRRIISFGTPQCGLVLMNDFHGRQHCFSFDSYAWVSQRTNRRVHRSLAL